jgi:hypothetical protein
MGHEINEIMRNRTRSGRYYGIEMPMYVSRVPTRSTSNTGPTPAICISSSPLVSGAAKAAVSHSRVLRTCGHEINIMMRSMTGSGRYYGLV